MKRVLVSTVALGLVMALATASWGAQARTRLASRTSQGAPAESGTDQSVISANGRVAAFQSTADNLPGANTYSQVYVHDRVTGKTRLASRTSGGEAGIDGSGIPSLSSNGRFVAFESEAPNLPGGNGVTRRVYVHDRGTGRTKLISRTGLGDPASGRNPYMSAGGRFVAFQSNDPGLPEGDGSTQRIYVADRETGRVRLASLTSDEQPVEAFDPALSGSGRRVVFSSSDEDLPGSDGNIQLIYVRDRRAGTTRLVSRNNQGEPADNNGCSQPAISVDGSSAAFYCESTNLPGGDGNTSLVYAFELNTRRIRLASRTSGGDPAEDDSYDPSLSGTGRYVTFYTNSDNLPGGEGYSDVYRFDLQRRKLVLVSRTSSGAPADDFSDSFNPAISADGRWVVFRSDAANLPGDGTQTYIRGALG